MVQSLKTLVVVLAIALAVFYLARPLCVQYMREATFVRRRNVWLALTVAGFLSPSFSLYALIAAPLLFWAGQHDDNPLTLYVLMAFVIPEVRLYLSLPGINQLFDLTQYRLLALTVLIPSLLRNGDGTRRTPDGMLEAAGSAAWRIEHTIALAFVLLQVTLSMPLDTMTTSLRRTFLGCIDVVLVIFAFSRMRHEEQLSDVMCGFWLACALMAPIGVFESIKGWLLYTGIPERWGDPNAFAWLFRGSSLRAQAAAGHSIGLGYLLAIGLGFYLHLRQRQPNRWTDAAVFAAFTAGIVVTYSRGAWITALLVVLGYVLLRPRSVQRLLSLAAGCAVVVAIMAMTPLRKSILAQLPFVGTASQDTIDYRRELLETASRLFDLHPWFGDPLVHLKMEHLRQGQGIIDFVNGYVMAALYYGGVGLALLVAMMAIPLLRALLTYVTSGPRDPELQSAGAALIASLAATLVFIATAGYGTTTYMLCGMLGCYATLVHSPRWQRVRNVDWSTIAAATRS